MRPFLAQTRFPVLFLAALVSLALAQPRAAFSQSNPKVPSPQQLAKGPQPTLRYDSGKERNPCNPCYDVGACRFILPLLCF
jgi:hypothetical protein